MPRNCLTSLLMLFSLIMMEQSVMGQFYTHYSRYAGGNQVEEVTDLQIINGEAYLLGTTRSNNFPSTNGSTYRGNLDITLTKFRADGSIEYATYLGGLGNDFATAMKIINNEVYISLYTDSINFPVTNNSVFKGRRDVVVAKLNASGNIAFATYLGGSGSDFPAFGAMEINNGRVIIAGTTGSPDLPVTNTRTYQGGINDGFAAVISSQDGSLISATFWGGNKSDFISSVVFDAQSLYLIGSSFSNDIPASIGSSLTDTLENGFIARLNFTNLDVQYSRYLGGNKRDIITKAVLADGMLHLTGYTGSSDFPVTNGTSISTQINDIEDGFYSKLNPDGQIVYSTFLTSEERDNPAQLIIHNGDAYIGGTSESTINGQKSVQVSRVNASGSIVYSKRFKIGTNRNNNVSPSFIVTNGELFITGVTLSSEYPVTNQSQFFSSGTGFFTRLGTNGDMRFSSFLGTMTNMVPSILQNGLFHMLGSTNTENYPISDGSSISGAADNMLIIMQTDGQRIFSGYTGGSGNEFPALLKADASRVYFAGKTLSNNYPVTTNQLYRANGDQFITTMASCPTRYQLDHDSISPSTQTACKLGLGEWMTGTDLQVPGDSLPLIYRNGVSSQQPAIPANYQWQSAGSPNGPWTDIDGATFRDYRPVLGLSDQYYRRAAFTLPFCGSSFIHYSDTAVVFINDLFAPIVNGGGTFITCPGFPVQIGGLPTAQGGNPPYLTYQWDQGATPVSNPVVTPGNSTLYTVTVTDTLGCIQIGQSVVLTYAAAAGPDKGACAGTAASIGTALIPGVQGLQYSWQPSVTLNNASIAQPLANPSVTTDYTLTLTVPVSGGNTCSTSDIVRVTPVAAPVTTDIAGPDKVFCLGSSVILGKAPEAGFNYVWSPGSYLSSNTLSTTTYYAGNTVMPVPNPAIVNVTAQRAGCFFADQTIVSTIEARAGDDGCGPRLVGKPDRTPDINEIYSWIKISGSGNFTGATNLPQVPVSASVGTETLYRLTVTHNGHSCTDDVIVPPFCSDCQTIIEVDAEYDCPSYSANGGNVTLIAFSSIDNAVFSWSPQEGLSTYTGNVVQLTDNIPRVYTVTARDINDSTRFCSDQILVNDPSFVKPVFPAPDTITCANQPVDIGLPSVAGYSYLWTGAGLSGNLSSNPTAIISITTSYPVIISDSSGCVLRDTVLVTVQNAAVNAGPDQILCSSGIVRLGVAAQPNTSYVWEPQSSPWQNNTNQFSAQPEVLVATSLDFTVTAITSAGCSIKDTVSVFIDADPELPNAPDTSICIGIPVRIGLPAIPGVVYQWSPSTGLNNAALAQPLANPLTTTTYTVSATFPGSCTSIATDQVTVTVKSAFFSMPDITFCPENGPVALGLNAPAGMQAYAWLPAQQVTNASIANPNTLNPPPKNLSTFTLQVTNQDGCRYRDTILLIPVITAPVAGFDRTICLGDSVSLGSAANQTGPGITYAWSPDIYLNDATSPTPQFTGTAGGIFTYIVTKTDQSVSCISRDTVIIRVEDVSFIMAPNTTVCQNSCIQIGTAPVTGIQYQWTPVNGLSDPNISNPIACVETGTANYQLSATNLNGCRFTQQILIAVSPIPAAQINIPDLTGCAGDTTLRFNPVITPTGPYTYLWSPDDGSLSNIRIADPFIRVAAPGTRTYQLQVTDTVTGCRNLANGLVTVSSCAPVSVIGDFIWFDLNANGLQDVAEPGVSGMAVRLFNRAGSNVASTITNPSGLYFFSNVLPDSGYYIIFSKPAGYDFTIQDIGGPLALNNSKASDSGRTNSFTVMAGTDILYIDAGIKVSGSGPVPVLLLGFTAQAIQTTTLLQWQTTAEIQNDYFDVQRSTDGRSFQSLGRVNGHGTSSLPHSYRFTDNNPAQGMNYYRLKQVDEDGRFSFSTIESVRFDINGQVISYYEPAAHEIRIRFKHIQGQTKAVLFAANGQRIAEMNSGQSVSEMTFSLPLISNGIYTLLLVNESMQFTQQMLIGK